MAASRRPCPISIKLETSPRSTSLRYAVKTRVQHSGSKQDSKISVPVSQSCIRSSLHPLSVEVEGFGGLCTDIVELGEGYLHGVRAEKKLAEPSASGYRINRVDTCWFVNTGVECWSTRPEDADISCARERHA